ncbi:MAG TPA: RIP metalloprotease RseP [Acidobacteriaceae bacterium]
MDFLLTVVYLIIVLGIMVLVHEFGHFAVAKLCGIRVETFSIGFGKRLFGIRRGDTDYRISLLPFGGYVKMAGDNPGEQATDPGDFNAHPRWQRVLVALAGPISNFILAFVIIFVVSMFHHEVEQYLTRPAVVEWVPAKTPAAALGVQAGDTIVHYDTVENPTWRDVAERSLLNLKQTIPFSYTHNGQRIDTSILVKSNGAQDDFSLDDIGFIPVLQDTPIQVMQLEAGMPAAEAGMQPKDQIVSIDGLPLHSVQALLAYMQDQGGKPATLVVLRGGQPLTIHLTPQISDAGDGVKQYRLGFRAVPSPKNIEKLSVGAAAAASWKSNKHDSALILTVLHHLFGGKVSVKNLSGPIGIGQEIGLAVKMGWWTVLQVMASISLNLGIFNLLPFPVLDGGMILFLIVESIIRRDVSQVWKERIYQAAFVVIILFAAFVIFNDISKLSPFAHMKP